MKRFISQESIQEAIDDFCPGLDKWDRENFIDALEDVFHQSREALAVCSCDVRHKGYCELY